MGKYRKKPVVIEAMQYHHDNSKEIIEALGMNFDDRAKERDCGYTDTGTFTIFTLEGNHYVSDGDFVIKGIKGEFYPCKPDIFEATYAEAKELTAIEKLLSLYHSERNFSITSFWDGGITVKSGDEMNGFKKEFLPVGRELYTKAPADYPDETVVGLESQIDEMWKDAGSPTEIRPFEERENKEKK